MSSPETSPDESSPESGSTGLSPAQTARALRAFTISSTFWGAWGRIVGVGTAVFTGFALSIGAEDTDIATYVSVASFASLAQVIASYASSRIRHMKRWVMAAGALEMLFRFSIVLVPLVFLAEGRVAAIGVCLGFGLLFGHLVSPVYNGWIASILPEDIRARFIARKTNANLVAGIIAGYGAGWFLDLFQENDRYQAFFALFAMATILGVAGYIRLMTVPYERRESEGPSGNILVTLRERPFLTLTIFFSVWHFALGIAGPFYSVFMLKQLNLSYSTVALLNNVFLVTMVIGYKVMGTLVDRYGSRALLNLCVPPTVLTPILWTFSSPDFIWTVAAAMALNGLLHAGILTATSSLLYGTIPEGSEKTTFFAAWSIAVNLSYAVAPLIGGRLILYYAPYAFDLFGFQIGPTQLVFLTSSGLLFLPLLLLGFVRDEHGASTRELLTQLGKGNIFSFVYGSTVYDRTESEQVRARAAHRMGRSKNPMALTRLIAALEDASPEVRRQAARGLGEARSSEAVRHLVEELRDEESDIRTEAAEALGKIGDPDVLDPLIDALDDPDSRVQISAIRALSEIGGDEATELLFWKFAQEMNRSTFPTLAEVLGQSRDLRIIKPTLQRLSVFKSPAIRLQLLNSVCRAVGARRRFYRLISLDPLERAQRAGALLSESARKLRRAVLPHGLSSETAATMSDIARFHDRGDAHRLLESVTSLVDLLQNRIDKATVRRLGTESSSRVGAAVLAIRTFLRLPDRETIGSEARDIFLLVCIWCLSDALSDSSE